MGIWRSVEGDAPYMGAMQIRALINSENTSCRAACLHPTLPLRVILNEVKDPRSRYTANLIVFAEILRRSLRMTGLLVQWVYGGASGATLTAAVSFLPTKTAGARPCPTK